MTDISKQLQAARQSLLDLTMRNRLLNFRPRKSGTIKIFNEIAGEVYDILVLQEKPMTFLPKTEEDEDVSKGEERQNLFEQLEKSVPESSQEESIKLWQLPTDDETSERHTDRYLQTALDRETLHRQLFRIGQQAHSALEEQGYTILYVALGFLEWTESPDSTEVRRAPLILIPVELQRTNVRKSFKLVWTGEDIYTNISLKAILSDRGVTLPEFETLEDKSLVDRYFQDVKKVISKFPKWNLAEDIYLGFFSFTKFVMYKDLDPASWPKEKSPIGHPLIKTIFDPSPEKNHDTNLFKEEEVDHKITSHDVFHVMDADPSQIAVIEDAKVGRNLLVEGPPGTGKSQTITNTIAELLAAGKTVLFVSEKMAALEVVKSRLDKVGLGRFCLELHSRKANKKEVLKELEKTIFGSPPTSVSGGEEYDQLENLKSELNDYAKALREPLGKFGRSPFALYCMRESALHHFEKKSRKIPHVSDLQDCEQSEYASAKSRLANLVEIIPLVAPLKNHPWRGCKVEILLPADQERVLNLIKGCAQTANDLLGVIKKLVVVCGISSPPTVEDLTNAINAARIVAESDPVNRQVLLNPEWNETSEQARRLIARVEEWHYHLTQTSPKFKIESLDHPVRTILEEYKNFSHKPFRIFSGRYRELKKIIAGFYKIRPPRSIKKVVSDLEQLEVCHRLRQEVREAEQAGKSLFGSYWQADTSDPKLLKAFSEWIVTFRKEILKGVLTEHSADLVSSGAKRDEIKRMIRNLEERSTSLLSQFGELVTWLGIDCLAVFGKETGRIPFLDLISRLKIWEGQIHRLPKWSQYVIIREEFLNTIAKPLIKFVEEDAFEPEDIVPCFEGNLADSLLHLGFSERLALARFDGDLHERKIKRFSELDRELILRNQKRLVSKLYKDQPRIAAGASSGSEAGILLGEFNRKRRHKPIRKLLYDAGQLIQKIKPCFMMSPLSIAQFLDPKSIQFDVVVFDEASQVKPADALGAFLRSKQVIIMGDTKQLPPTSFFDHMVEADDQEEEESAPVSDVESILHLCKRSLPSRILRWHYRSKHESLVAVSNQEFYDNQLLIYPSAIDKAPSLGLEFIHLPDTVYDRGRSSVNRKEAQLVAVAAVDHYRKFPDKSLGVGAFNIKQQEAILEEIELQLRLNLDIEDLFSSDRDEHFFVKNLETIQGDERDVIFLSIGFGFDEARRLTQNFGPLNQEGGERRLNVLITRARERCVVFSNFRAIDLSLDETAPFGLRALKVFLDYAETRNLQAITVDRTDTDSPFEDSVYEFLQSNNYEVRKQVGCAKFRVDLAVVDSHSPGRYLLGIECDGYKYHTSPVARDRDRLRQQILEGLGWRIHRIWSTDWYRNRRETQRKLLEALGRAKQEKSTIPSPALRQPTDSIKKTETLIRDESEHRDRAAGVINVNEKTVEGASSEYKCCTSLTISITGDLYEQPAKKLALAVANVVEVEGPVHFDEVVRRIRSLWGLKRSGDRIEEAIRNAVAMAERQGQIRRSKKFLWPKEDRPMLVRRRIDDPPPKIEFICNEEIAEATRLILNRQFATSLDDLIIETSRLLGFEATRSETFDTIKSVIQDLIKNEHLVQMPNGMIHFAKV